MMYEATIITEDIMIGNRYLFPLFTLIIWQILSSAQVAAEPVLVHLTSIPGAKRIESIYVRDEAPNEIILGTENLGADCGWGTPASIWKVSLDPLTGLVQSSAKMQDLSKIQKIRGTIAESSDGTLFTGGGWCGYKPPYYSTDGGVTWNSADTGNVHPPNSTFSFVEFRGEMYAGTGYKPYPGEVYRWLGNGNWEHVFTFPSPSRNIVDSMQVHDNNLFVSALIYGSSPCSGSQGIYVSSDDHSFDPTTGISSCDSILTMFKVGQDLFALTANIDNRDEKHIYVWEEQTWRHLGISNFLWTGYHPIVVDGGFTYSYGRPPENAIYGIYRSSDFGLNWQLVAPLQNPGIIALHVHGNTLYAGTMEDNNLKAHLYKVNLSEENCNCAAPGAIKGTSGPNFLYGTEQADIICGLGDQDFIAGLGGDDCIDGGDGDDWIHSGHGDDTIYGGDGKDVIYGNRGNDKINGGADEDYLFGSGGDDKIDGGEGSDWVFCGGGTDEGAGEYLIDCEK
jgi:hypothetical protein